MGRNAGWLAGVVVASLAMGGCGGGGGSTGTSGTSPTDLVTVSVAPPHTLVFSITGSGTIATLVYTVDGQATTLSSVKAPWQASIPIPAGSGPSSWTLAYTGSGSLSDTVSLDGSTVTYGSCDGGCDQQASGSFDA